MIKRFYFVNPKSNKPGVVASKTFSCIRKTLNDVKVDLTKDPTIDESPFVSLQRILGEKFYEFENTKDDYLAINLEEDGLMTLKGFEQDMESREKILIPFVSGLIELFSAQVVKFPIPKEDAENLNIKVSMVTTHGIISKEVNVKELGLWDYDDKGDIIGILHETEMQNAINSYNRTAQACQKLQQTKLDNSTRKQLESLHAEQEATRKKYDEYTKDIAANFFKFISNFTGIEIENIEIEVNSIAFIFSREQVSDTEDKTSIFETSVLVYQNRIVHDIVSLKNFFMI